MANEPMKVQLPSPRTTGTVSLEETLQERRSIRNFAPYAITAKEIGQLLWSGQGITLPARGFRTAPSAGATFPLELYIAVFRSNEVAPGLYHYDIRDHALTLKDSDFTANSIVGVALRQMWINDASAAIIITAVAERTASRYGDRATRYIDMEVGHVGQNISLQAVALDLGTTMVGAFNDAALADVLGLPRGEMPLYVIPVGKPE